MPYKPTGNKPGRPRKEAFKKRSLPIARTTQGKLIAPPHERNRPKQNPKWRAALKVEWENFASARTPWPSNATGPAVAAAAGVSRETVRKWRADPAYREALFRLSAAKVWRAIRAERPERNPPRSKRRSDANLHVHLKTHWTGPIESPLDGKTYNDPKSFFEHIAANAHVVWTGDQPRNKRR